MQKPDRPEHLKTIEENFGKGINGLQQIYRAGKTVAPTGIEPVFEP